MTLLRALLTFYDHTIEVLFASATLVPLVLALAVTYEVVTRYFVGQTTVWITDVAAWSLVWFTFLGAAYVLKREGHIKMDLVLERLRGRTRMLLIVITSIIGAIVCLAITWYGVQVTWEHFQKGILEFAMIDVPKAPLLMIIPVGSFLLFVQFMRRTHTYLVKLREFQAEE